MQVSLLIIVFYRIFFVKSMLKVLLTHLKPFLKDYFEVFFEEAFGMWFSKKKKNSITSKYFNISCQK